MVRLHRVKKSRVNQGACGSCGKKLRKGCSYLWWKFKRAGRRVRCTECPPQPWDLVSNHRAATIMQAQDTAHKALAVAVTVDEIRDTLSTLADEVQGVSGEYQESIDAIMEHFPSGNQVSEEIEEKISSLDDWASTMECHEPDEFEEGANEEKDDWFDNIRSEAEALIDDNPL